VQQTPIPTHTRNVENLLDFPQEDLIFRYFTQLTESQKKQFKKLSALYTFWNSQINLISRKDIGQLYLRHVLHALSIAKVISFKADTKILDVGTGGGFPGIPLAILFPKANFHLIDSIGKKIKAVQQIAEALALPNVYTSSVRAEAIHESYDFILGKAVTDLPTFYGWVKDKVRKKPNHTLANGILYLKGGDFLDELTTVPLKHHVYPIKNFFNEPFFDTKKLVHLAYF